MKSSIYILMILIVFGCKNPIKRSNTTFVDKSHIQVSSETSRDSNWAINEFNRDKIEQLKLIRYGPPPDDKEENFWNVLANYYNIEIKFSLGCFIDEGVEYYNTLMTNEITKKYGVDFYKVVNEKVDSIYKIDRLLINKIRKSNIIDTTLIARYQAFDTPDKNIKVICGYGWYPIDNSFWMTNYFRIAIDIKNLKIINIDTNKIAIESYYKLSDKEILLPTPRISNGGH